MPRYILIDNASGYIFGDSADIGGRIVNGTPVEVAKALDESIGEYGRLYEELDHRALPAGATAYHVYRADVGGSEQVVVALDGQDPEAIAAVERDCEYVTTLRTWPAMPTGARVEGGAGADHDTGRVVDPTDADREHPMAAGPNVLVVWGSGVRTWTPVADLRTVD